MKEFWIYLQYTKHAIDRSLEQGLPIIEKINLFSEEIIFSNAIIREGNFWKLIVYYPFEGDFIRIPFIVDNQFPNVAVKSAHLRDGNRIQKRITILDIAKVVFARGI